MSKRNVAYIKPQDPSFLAKLKAQIGPSNEPTIETKRQKLQADYDSDPELEHVREDEKPQIVVLKNGDLTAEEVERIAKEAAEAPADLNQRVLFRKRKPDTSKGNQSSDSAATPKPTTTKVERSSAGRAAASASSTTSSSATKSRQKINSIKLSFIEDDDDDENENGNKEASD